MLAAPHAAAGATLAALVPSPRLALPLALGSHFVLDTVPHWQEVLPPYTPTRQTAIRVPLDLAAATLLVWWAMHLRPERARVTLATSLAAIAPDLDAIFFLRPALVPPGSLIERYFHWHIRIQRETRSRWGMVTQLAVIAAGMVLVKRS